MYMHINMCTYMYIHINIYMYMASTAAAGVNVRVCEYMFLCVFVRMYLHVLYSYIFMNFIYLFNIYTLPGAYPQQTPIYSPQTL